MVKLHIVLFEAGDHRWPESVLWSVLRLNQQVRKVFKKEVTSRMRWGQVTASVRESWSSQLNESSRGKVHLIRSLQWKLGSLDNVLKIETQETKTNLLSLQKTSPVASSSGRVPLSTSC